MVRRGEVYLVNLERGRGTEQHGTRPALIVQSDEGNQFSASTIIAAMSTQASGHFRFRVVVQPEDSGLRGTSTVMLDQLRTIGQERLRSVIGRVSPSVMEEVDRALRYSLGLLE